MNPYSPLVGAAVHKARWRLLPMLILMYIMSILDRVNVGFAKNALQIDTGLSDGAFALGAGIFFVSYALFEVPSNVIMTRIGPRIWLSRIMVSWGLVASAMMFATTETSFYLLRFLLGIAEAGFYPGVLLTLTYWFPARVRAQANGILLFGFAGALVIGGPVSGALLEMHGIGGLKGWEWMFLIEGAMAVVVGIAAFFVIVDRPHAARWLASAEQDALQAVLDQEAAQKAAGSPYTVMQTLRNPKVMFFALNFFIVQIAAYGLIFYLPSQVSQILGQKIGLMVGFVTSIPWLLALFVVYFVTRWSDRHHERRRLTVASLYTVFGVCVCLSAHGSPIFAIAALSIGASTYLSGTPIFYAFLSERLSGLGIATGIALVNSIGNLGGFVAPNLRTYVEQNHGGSAAGLYTLGGAALLAALMLALMPRGWRTVIAVPREGSRPGTALEGSALPRA
jgi:MFS family permease